MPARAWFAEAREARWKRPKDVLKQYEDAEILESATILVPLDEAGHCVVFIVEYRCGLLVIDFAGQKGRYAMRKRRIGGQP